EFFAFNDSADVREDSLWFAHKAVARGLFIKMAATAKRKYNLNLQSALAEVARLESCHKACPSPQLFSNLSDARLRLRQLLLHRAENSLRKSKAKFYSMGDRAGALLAKRVKKKEAQTKIAYLLKSDGSQIYNPIHIAEEFASYYSSLYNLDSDVNTPQLSQDSINAFLNKANLPTVNPEQLSLLNGPIEAIEISQIIKEAKKRSAPGPDGFSFSYYSHFLTILSPFLIRLFNYWRSMGTIEREGLEACISTLPKPGKPMTSPGNFRPIALLNCDVKIYAKVWANRLLSVLPSLVHSDQVGFVPGRQTRDGTRRLIDLLDVVERRSLPKHSVLQRGLSFCPTPPFNDFTLDQELNRFYRSLQLKVHFSKSDIVTPVSQISTASNGNEILTLKKLNLTLRSSFSPPRTYHPVETFISLIQNDVDKQLSDIHHSRFHVSSNMSRAEKLAINSLRSNKKLIIKPADKGGAVVVMDKQYYIREIRSQLSDSEIYLPITYDPTFKCTKEIQTLSHQFSASGVIDHKLGEFLINTHPICPVLYTLPKIHKDLTSPPGETDRSLYWITLITIGNCPGEDFVSTNGSYPLLSPVPTDCYLVSLDINSLYTNIDNEKGISAVENFLNNNTQFPCDLKVFCRTLLTFTLTKNFFLFEDEFFLQRNGTAMGSNVAPPYANIFMADFESNFVYTHPLFQQYCILWKRFIDDIFLVWCGDIKSLVFFHQYINQCVTKLTFTIHYDHKSISFLDTQVIVNEDGSLSTDLYVKPTDKNSLLLFTSCHSHHIKRALPLSQFQRINRIVSDSSQRTLRLKDMALKFQNRGYPDTLLKHSPDALSSRTVRRDTRRMAFVSTHHPFMRLFHRIIHKHWPLLGLLYPDIPEFLSPPLMCHKKPPNLCNLLVSADVGSARKEIRQTVLGSTRKGTFPCLHCLQCSNISKGDTFTHPRSGKRFPIRNYYNCDSTYVIYLIKCPCGLGYVGETTQHIRDRISQHKSTIRCKKIMLPIPAHLISHNHNISQLRYQ
ncbi:unnamed protein product, partial [Ranitomeya imitator]